jgi:hypothetical protein
MSAAGQYSPNLNQMQHPMRHPLQHLTTKQLRSDTAGLSKTRGRTCSLNPHHQASQLVSATSSAAPQKLAQAVSRSRSNRHRQLFSLTLVISVLTAISPRSVNSFNSRPPPAPATTSSPAMVTGLNCLGPGCRGSLSWMSPVSMNCSRPFSPPAKPPVAPAAGSGKSRYKQSRVNAVKMEICV